MWNSGDFETSKYSMADFREWAGSIANSFLNSDITPTSSLEKIAKDEELSPHQIELLAAETNKLIHQSKYASVANKYHAADFPLADAKAVIEGLQIGETVKTASFQEPVFQQEELDYDKFFGLDMAKEGCDKTAMVKVASVKHQLQVAVQSFDQLMSKHADQRIVDATDLENAELGFIKQARQLAFEGDNSIERMKILGMCDALVKEAGSKASKKLLAKVAYVLGKEGKLEPAHATKAIEYFTKEADCTAPDELISENMPARIVNGDHPLYISIKTIDNIQSRRDRNHRDAHLVHDKLQILKQKIRAL